MEEVGFLQTGAQPDAMIAETAFDLADHYALKESTCQTA